MKTSRRLPTSEEVTSKHQKGAYITIMPGGNAQSKNALTRAQAEALLQEMPQLPKISIPRQNRM